MKLRFLLIILLLLVLLFPIFSVRSSSIVKFDVNNCRLVKDSSAEVVVECSPHVLYSRDGLFIGIKPDDAYVRGLNSLRFELVYSLNYNDVGILVTLFRGDSPRIEIVLPTNRDYAGKYVVGWSLSVVLFEYFNNKFVHGDAKTISLTGDYPPSGWVVSLPHSQYFGFVQLYPQTGSPSQQQKQSWAPANDWFKTFNDLLNSVGQGLSAGVSIFITALSFLVNILQYLPIIIPLHIVAAFIDSPERGVSAINFYISLGRKLIDLVVKLIHAIVSLIDAVTPFT